MQARPTEGSRWSDEVVRLLTGDHRASQAGDRVCLLAGYDPWPIRRGHPTEFVEVDDSRLIVVNHTHLRGRGSGVEVDAVGAQLWTINDDGKRVI